MLPNELRSARGCDAGLIKPGLGRRIVPCHNLGETISSHMGRERRCQAVISDDVGALI